MRLVLVRHGETEHNRGQLTLGRHDAPLNERGIAQARALGRSFVTPPAVVYSSPLLRAVQTAEEIAREAAAEVRVEPGLIEMDVGEMEHLTRDELRERFPDFVRLWLSDDVADARMPGGETLREVQERAWACVESLLARHPDVEVVAVTHNFVILTLLCRALDLPLARFRRLRQGLAARTVVEVTDGGATLLQLNDNAHLVAGGMADELRGREVRP